MLYANGMSYADAMAMSPKERLVMEIVFGTLRGGTYNYKERKWSKPPMSM